MKKRILFKHIIRNNIKTNRSQTARSYRSVADAISTLL